MITIKLSGNAISIYSEHGVTSFHTRHANEVIASIQEMLNMDSSNINKIDK